MAQVLQSLPQLQNKIKREPDTYKDDFLLQLRSFEAQYEIFKLHPTKESKEFCRLIQFICQVSYLYPKDSAVVAKKLVKLLHENHSILDPELRKVLFQSLVLLRNRGQLDARELIELCFSLFACEDKHLRESLYNHILSDIRNINKKSTNLKLNRSVQNVLFTVLEGQSTIAAKKSLQVIIELYKKRVWTDARTVNVIAGACFSRITKNVVVAIQFFLGIDEQIDAIQEEEEEEASKPQGDADLLKKPRKSYSKKTRARLRKLEKEVKALKKVKEQRKATAEARRASAPRFPAIDLINDTQGFVEKLYKQVKSSTEHFEVRLMMMNLVSRIIGHHRLIFLPLYTFLQKYMQPHQRHVTNVLAFAIQASHDLIPPEELEPMVKLIANNFVTDRSGPEVMAVGLNSIREILVRVPLISEGEGMDDLIGDLIQYRKYRRDRSVVMAARSMLNALREINPAVLQRKERGKFHDEDAKPMEYGQIKVAEGVEGAELLQAEEERLRLRRERRGEDAGDSDSDDDVMELEEDEEAVEEGDAEEEEEGDAEEEEGDADAAPNADEDATMDEEEQGKPRTPKTNKRKRSNSDASNKTPATKSPKPDQKDRIDAKRLFTAEDFEKIRELKRKADAEKKNPRNRRKNPKPAHEDADEDEFEFSEDEEEYQDPSILNPNNLEGVVKRRRKELHERLESVYAGRDEAELTKRRTGGTSNLEKEKTTKNFLMTMKSSKVKRKQTMSLRQQQYTLKKHIKTLEKKKKLVQKVRRRK